MHQKSAVNIEGHLIRDCSVLFQREMRMTSVKIDPLGLMTVSRRSVQIYVLRCLSRSLLKLPSSQEKQSQSVTRKKKRRELLASVKWKRCIS